MTTIKSLDTSAKKFATNASQAGTAYNDGVNNPKRDWANSTKAAESNYESGVQAGIQRKAFGKGVSKAGSSKWQKGATEKGSARFTAGVGMAQDAYAKGFAPFHQAISSATLPPRFAKRDPRNIERVKAVVNVMGKTKEQVG